MAIDCTAVPSELSIYPDTDVEGEPQIKTANELWPFPGGDDGECSTHSDADEVSSTASTARTQTSLPVGFAGALGAARGQWSHISAPRKRRDVQKRVAELTSTIIDQGDQSGKRAADSVTTLAVRNLAESTTLQELLSEIDRSGFEGVYDFAYRQEGRHYAFLNFKTAEIALAFAVAWQGTRRLGLAPGASALSVEAASVQGFRANVAKWTPAKMARAKDTVSVPFISEEASPTDQVTTLAVRNLPRCLTQQEFLDEVNNSGFAGKYDFAYLPRSRDSGLGSGHAFLNFVTAEVAAAFQAAWHLSARFAECSATAVLNVTPSVKQGFHENAARWSSARLAKAKSNVFIPFIARAPWLA